MVLAQHDYPIPALISGLLLLLFGRQLFWLLIAVAGFVLGVIVAHECLPHQEQIIWLAAGIAFGVAGILLAVFAQKLALVIAGFLGGGLVALASVHLATPGMSHPFAWLAFVIGGVLGAILMHAVFAWALIFITAIDGAHILASAIPARGWRGWDIPRRHHPLLVLVLAVIGIAFQATSLRRPRVAESK